MTVDCGTITLAVWRALSERVPRDSHTSAVSGCVRPNGGFACSVPARNACLAPVAAHHDMTACLCCSLFIGRGVLASWMSTVMSRTRKSTRTRRIPPALDSGHCLEGSNRTNISESLMMSLSQAEGPPGSPGILALSKPPPLLSSTAPAFERSHAFTSSRDWVTHPTNSAGGGCLGCRCVDGGGGLDSARKSHFFVSALFRTATVRRCLAALLLMQARASSSARVSFLHTRKLTLHKLSPQA